MAFSFTEEQKQQARALDRRAAAARARAEKSRRAACRNWEKAEAAWEKIPQVGRRWKSEAVKVQALWRLYLDSRSAEAEAADWHGHTRFLVALTQSEAA